MLEGPVRYLMIAALAAIHLGLALVLGSVASQLWLRGAPSEWRARTQSQARWMHLVGLGLGSLGLLAAVWLEAASMADDGLGASVEQVQLLLGSTHFGRAWMVGVAGWLVAGALLLKPSSIPCLAGGLSALGVFVLTRSVVSHAGSQGDFTLAVAVDWMHLVLVSLWVGIVVAGALQRLPHEGTSLVQRYSAIRWVSLMSEWATMAIVGIGATGLYKVLHGVELAGSFGGYLDSAYGYALITKLALITAAASFGAYNKFVVMPRLFKSLTVGDSHAAEWRRALVGALRGELVVLVIVLVAAALLSSTEAPVVETSAATPLQHISDPFTVG